jgi:hypothetical protein
MQNFPRIVLLKPIFQIIRDACVMALGFGDALKNVNVDHREKP